MSNNLSDDCNKSKLQLIDDIELQSLPPKKEFKVIVHVKDVIKGWPSVCEEDVII